MTVTDTPATKPVRASATPTAPAAPAHPLIGTVIAPAGVGATAVSIDGTEFTVDPKTGRATGLRA